MTAYIIAYTNGMPSEICDRPLQRLRHRYPELEAYDESGNAVIEDDDLMWVFIGDGEHVRVWRNFEDSINDDGDRAVANIRL